MIRKIKQIYIDENLDSRIMLIHKTKHNELWAEISKIEGFCVTSYKF